MEGGRSGEKRRAEEEEEEEEGVAVVIMKTTATAYKNKRDEWSEAAILTLLDAYESKWSLRNRAKLKGSDWEEIAFHVSSRTTTPPALKNPNQCKNKIESMKKKYRLESSQYPSTWPFYGRMDQLLNPPSKLQQDQLLHPLINNDPKKLTTQVQVDQEDDEINGENNNNHHVAVEGSNNNNNNNNNNESDDDDTAAPPIVNNRVEEEEEEEVGEEKRRRRRRRFRDDRDEYYYLGESIRLVGRCIMKIEQGRIDMYRECERMRLECEMKRAELDLKRTQIMATTQLQIANLFANYNNTQPQPQPPPLLVDTTTPTTGKKQPQG